MVGFACRLSPGGKRAFFWAQNQAALALLQRWSWSTNQPPTRVGCKAKLVSPPPATHTADLDLA